MTTWPTAICDGCFKHGREAHDVMFRVGLIYLRGDVCLICMPERDPEKWGRSDNFAFRDNVAVQNALKANVVCHLINIKAPKEPSLAVTGDDSIEIYGAKQLFMKLPYLVAAKLLEPKEKP